MTQIYLEIYWEEKKQGLIRQQLPYKRMKKAGLEKLEKGLLTI